MSLLNAHLKDVVSDFIFTHVIKHVHSYLQEKTNT